MPAIEVRQSKGRKLYSFAVDGKAVPKFAAISRVKREEGKLTGYQRPEVLSHIEEIRTYLETESPMVPNAVVIAFDSRVRFDASKGGPECSYSRTGVLRIPVDERLGEAEKPGFVVDGQQRLAAIRDAEIDAFPVCVSAFITDDVQEQTEQFILVNSTKPLPKGLLYELLPTTQAQLPSLLHRRRFPALLLERLNGDASSPFYQLIQTPTNPAGVVKDNSILRMVENSLSDGALYRFRFAAGDDPDVDSMLKVLSHYWSAVSQVFPNAWNQPPKRSRLMHGAGIVSMGFIMDAICDRYRQHRVPSVQHFLKDLKPLEEVCRWTDGFWDFGANAQRKWNELQNTSKDIELLSNFLIMNYKALVWGRTQAGSGRQRSIFGA
ncbi:MAG: DGQHR domain-containing protein DpdB [Myxococcaceae bacterium]